MQNGLRLIKWTIVVGLLSFGVILILAGSGMDVGQATQGVMPGARAIARATNFATSLLENSRLAGHALGVGVFLFVCGLLATLFRV